MATTQYPLRGSFGLSLGTQTAAYKQSLSNKHFSGKGPGSRGMAVHTGQFLSSQVLCASWTRACSRPNTRGCWFGAGREEGQTTNSLRAVWIKAPSDLVLLKRSWSWLPKMHLCAHCSASISTASRPVSAAEPAEAN